MAAEKPPMASEPTVIVPPPSYGRAHVVKPVEFNFKGVPAKKEEVRKRFWYGMMPGPRTIDAWFGGPKLGADEAWLADEKPITWIGKLEYFQNIDVNGMHFAAFSEPPQSDINKDRVRVPVPGRISYLYDEQLERAKKAVQRTVIRIEEESDEEFAERAAGYKEKERTKKARQITVQDPDWIDEAGKIHEGTKNQLYSHNPRIDHPLGKYVYMIEVDKDFVQPTLEDFLRNPPPAMILES